MRLSQILEARYAYPGYVQWAEEAMNKRGEHELDVPAEDRKIVLRQLSKRFGPPHHQEFPDDEPEREYFMWQNEPGASICFDLTYWPQFESMILHTHRYAEWGDLHEAQYQTHPAVDMIKRTRETKEHLDHKFPLKELDRVLAELTREFGPPEHHNREMWTGGSTERWMWSDFVVLRYEGFGYIENSKLYR